MEFTYARDAVKNILTFHELLNIQKTGQGEIMYIIVGNRNFTEGKPLGYSKTKKEAIDALHKAGYRFNSEFKYYETPERWAKIEKFPEISTVDLSPKSVEYTIFNPLGGILAINV